MSTTAAERASRAAAWARLAGTPDRRWRSRVPMALAAVAVLCQIVYPLVDGGARDALTVATVVVFAAASLSHAAVSRGVGTAAAAAGAFVGGGLLVEAVGVATGLPFGTYAYSPRLGPMLAEVPLIIPLAWAMLGWPALVMARRITARPLPGIAIGAVALTAWDLFLDPQMVAEGYWTWTGGGPYLLEAIPVSNYVAWLGVSALMMAALWPATRGWQRADDDRVPVALYVWTWAGSALAHVAFFDLWRSGLYGFVAMGAIVLAAWRTASAANPGGANAPSAADTPPSATDRVPAP